MVYGIVLNNDTIYHHVKSTTALSILNRKLSFGNIIFTNSKLIDNIYIYTHSYTYTPVVKVTL